MSRPSSRSGRSGERSPFEGSCCGSSYVSSESSLEIAKYRVVLLGESGVGKTSLVSQFMTSEYINTYDASLDEEFGEKSVSVLLDGDENEVTFIDHPAHEMSGVVSLGRVQSGVLCLRVFVYVQILMMLASLSVSFACRSVYTQIDKSESLSILFASSGICHAAMSLIYCLRLSNVIVQICDIYVLPGIPEDQYTDLTALRVWSNGLASPEAKTLASCHDSKFIETSSGIQHNVDELLVGIVKQVRLRLAAQRKRLKKMSSSKTSLSLHAAKELLSKMCLLDNKSKSCENLHVL
nr:ras-related protein Ral-A-like [Penaeus vannamei]